ncbi:hypothetical protein MGN70_009400 [Eutypa lata]|nr:hypothetical protein MGN70_009400 [Eutypa lata]
MSTPASSVLCFNTSDHLFSTLPAESDTTAPVFHTSMLYFGTFASTIPLPVHGSPMLVFTPSHLFLERTMHDGLMYDSDPIDTSVVDTKDSDIETYTIDPTNLTIFPGSTPCVGRAIHGCEPIDVDRVNDKNDEAARSNEDNVDISVDFNMFVSDELSALEPYTESHDVESYDTSTQVEYELGLLEPSLEVNHEESADFDWNGYIDYEMGDVSTAALGPCSHVFETVSDYDDQPTDQPVHSAKPQVFIDITDTDLEIESTASPATTCSYETALSWNSSDSPSIEEDLDDFDDSWMLDDDGTKDIPVMDLSGVD